MFQFLRTYWNQVSGRSSRRRMGRRVAMLEALEGRTLLTAPVAIDGSGNAFQSIPLSGTVASLATDAENDKLTFAVVANPTHGTILMSADGKFAYKSDAAYTGPDSFTFKANDGADDSNVATFKLTVKPESLPVVVNGSANPDEDVAYSGTLVPLASDADNNTLTFSVVAQPTHGTLTLNADGTFTYTPALNYSGPDAFQFKANDGIADSNTGTFNLNVSPVNDALKITMSSNIPQVARNTGSIRIDASATVGDIDTVVNYSKAKIRVSIFSGNSNGDNQKSRVILTVLGQTPGPQAVTIKSGKIFYDGAPQAVGRYSGGVSGHALTIHFTKGVTEEIVNAVLKQISIRLEKDAALGTRAMQYTVTTSRQVATILKSVQVV